MNDEKHILIIVTLLMILVLALVINYVIYKRQEAAQQRRLKARKIQGMLPDLLECLRVLKQTECSSGITQLMEKYASELLDEMAKLSASPALLNKLQNSSATNETNTTNAPIQPKQVQLAVSKTMTVVQNFQKNNQITLQQLMQFTVELKTTQLLFDIDNLLNLSEKAIIDKKIAVAKGSLRTIKAMLLKIPDNDPRKEKLNNRTNKVSKDVEPVNLSVQEAPTPSPEST